MARLQNGRPTKYLTEKNCSRSPPVVRFAKEILTSHVAVRECGSTSIPCSISTLITWNRLREYGTAGALVSDCAQECWTAGTPSSIPRSVSTLITWNRLRENGTAVALVVYPLNIFFLATVGLLTVAVQEHSFYSLRFKYSASHDCGTTGGVLKVRHLVGRVFCNR